MAFVGTRYKGVLTTTEASRTKPRGFIDGGETFNANDSDALRICLVSAPVSFVENFVMGGARASGAGTSPEGRRLRSQARASGGG